MCSPDVAFTQHKEVCFEHRLANRRGPSRQSVTGNQGEISASVEPGLRQRLANLDALSTTTERVRASAAGGLPLGLITVEDVARKLALSQRTLQRRMEREGTSFQDILNRTREGLARHYLERTQLPIAEISFLLGFKEANSSYRAFKGWTATTPDEIRRRQERHFELTRCDHPSGSDTAR